MAIVLDSSIVLVYMWVARWYLIWSGTAYSSREPDFTPCVGGVGVAHHGFLDFCVVICLSSSYVLLSKCCQCLRTVHSWSLLLFSLTFIYLFTSCVLCTQCSQCLRTVHSWLLIRFSITSCILCTQCCQCLRTVHFWLLLRFSLTFTCLFTSCIRCTQLLPVSPDCPLLIAPSVFSNAYYFWYKIYMLDIGYWIYCILKVSLTITTLICCL